MSSPYVSHPREMTYKVGTGPGGAVLRRWGGTYSMVPF